MTTLRNLWNDDAGQDLVEYALIIAVVAVGIVAALTTLKGNINTAFTNITNGLTGA